MMHWDGSGGWWVAMFIGMLLFWAAVAVLIYTLLRGTLVRRSLSLDTSSRTMSAREILQQRLAAGEISTDEYDRLVQKLGEG